LDASHDSTSESETEPATNGDAAGFYQAADDADFSLDLTTPRDGRATNGDAGNGNGKLTNGRMGNGTGTETDGAVAETNDAAAEANGAAAETNGTAAKNGDVAPGEAAEGKAAEDGDDSALLTDAADVDVDDDTDDDEVEPVELLVQLAEDGEIDPWDIDIVAVTDAFLERLDESDLRTSGRALFYASVLLRMKSDAILTPDEPEEESWEDAMGMSGGEPFDPEHDPIDALESEIDRRLDRKHARGSPETLDELVRELREAEFGSWWKEGRTYDTSDSPHGYDRGTQTLDYRAADDFRDEGEPDEAAVTGTAHMEDIEATITDVERALRSHYDKGRDEVLFAEVRREGGRPVQTFLALLFLAHRGVVHLQQDDLFGDLWIQNPAVAAVGDEAIAD
jgi:segregation and condensation protein A